MKIFQNLFHKHDFQEVNREFMDMAIFRNEKRLGWTPITVITYKCSKCTKHKQITRSAITRTSIKQSLMPLVYRETSLYSNTGELKELKIWKN